MDILTTLFHQRTRSIDIIVPDVVISEKHSDTLEITEHPVEKGAKISDHAFRRPAELIMEVGFAGGGSLLDFTDTTEIGLSLLKGPKEIYQQLRDLQESRTPFDVITGKRMYKNMLMRALEVTTDRLSEHVLSAVVTLREVIITGTTTVEVAEKAKMKEGVSTSGVKNTGVKTPVPVNESILFSLGKGAAALAGIQLGQSVKSP